MTEIIFINSSSSSLVNIISYNWPAVFLNLFHIEKKLYFIHPLAEIYEDFEKIFACPSYCTSTYDEMKMYMLSVSVILKEKGTIALFVWIWTHHSLRRSCYSLIPWYFFKFLVDYQKVVNFFLIDACFNKNS